MAGLVLLLSLLGSTGLLGPVASANAATGYRIQSGDTLHGLHVRFHRSVRCLARRNRLANPDLIITGRVLRVPSRTWCHHRHHAHHARHARVQRASRSANRVALRRVHSVGSYKRWARRHVGRGQFWALNTLWMHESGWNRFAKNPSSGAYGIPQALPATKMGTAGSDWSWNGYTQMRWGLRYIRARYGSPVRAWSFWAAHHWY